MVCLMQLQKLIHSEEYHFLHFRVYLFFFPQIQISLRKKNQCQD